MSKKRKLVYGIGINDASYVVKVYSAIGYVNGKKKRKTLWQCPFHSTWVHMLQRCYSNAYHIERPTYIGCSIVDDWKYFSNFKAWMESQDWEGKSLDKDLLIHDNKIYSPATCVFVDAIVNSFMTERTLGRGEWPIGVNFHKNKGMFQARCRNPFTKNQEYLGQFTCPDEAHQAWLKRKRELAHELAALQTDPRVAEALIDRYSVDVYVPLTCGRENEL